MAASFTMKEWMAIINLPADGKIRSLTVTDGDARVCHTPETKMHWATLLLESPVDGKLWRKVRRADGGWSVAHQIDGTIDSESTRT